MRTLWAVLFNLLFYTSTLLLSLCLVPILAFGQRAGQLIGRYWCHLVQWMLKATISMDKCVQGTDNLPKGPCILVSKHQSAWETMTFHTLLDNPVYVLKKQLLHMPVFGLFLRASGQIGIDRSAGASALKNMVKAVDHALKHGHQVIIFPEGTRTPPGSDRQYHPGIYALYRTFPDIPMIPVALNSGMFWGRHRFMKYPGKVTLEYLIAMPKGLERKTFMTKIKHRIDTRTRELEEEARKEFCLPSHLKKT